MILAEEAVGTESVGSGAVTAEVVATPPEGAGTEGESGAVQEPRYTVKSGGKEQEVTLDELLNGYQRQSDYTRKTQELAAERTRLTQAEQVYRAIETDPANAIPALARLMGIDLGTPQGQAAVKAAEASDDPVSVLTSKVDQWMSVQQQREAAENQSRQQVQQQATLQAQIEQQLETLTEQHGTFDRTALMQFAVNAGIPDLSSAYGAFKWAEAEDARLLERNKAVEAKRGAQVVEGGRSPQSGAVGTSTKVRMSVREAYEAAKRG